MISAPIVVGAAVVYLALLFAVAAFADARARAGRSIIGNAWIYALSLAVYCTAWTYFGSVGRAAATGVWFLPIYLGPMLAMLLAWIVVRKMIRIAHTYRITSIADFIASRYGKSPLVAALVTLITVVGIVPYIALQLKAVSAGYQLLTASGTAGSGTSPAWWQDGTLLVTLALALFTILFGARHLDSAERHEGMVAAVAFESLVKLVAFLAVGVFVTYGLFNGMADIWARARAVPELASLLRLGGTGGAGAFGYAQWFTLTLLSMLSVLLLPRQFQMMVVECVNEPHLKRAAWVFPAYLLVINIFVLPLALGGLLLGPNGADPETFVLSLPLANGATGLALFAYVGGLSAATGMLIVETIAVSTMVCNDLVMPALLRRRDFGARAGGDLTALILNIRRAAILAILLLGYLYFQVAGEAYALVSIGLISFAAVAQFAPALFGGMYWREATRAGALGGLCGGFLVWAYTLMAPSVAKSGWIDDGFLIHGPFGITALAPERLFGLQGLDNLSHSLFWSLLVNVALYVGLSLWRAPSGREASQALLFVDVFARGHATAAAGAADPVFWRGRARPADLMALASRLLGPDAARQIFTEHAHESGVAVGTDLTADARLVDKVERRLAGAVGSASARVLVAAVAEEEPLSPADVMEILNEASQLRVYALALEEKSRSLEIASAELSAANAQLRTLDELKDDFVSSVTHELRTPLTAIRALSELMLDAPDMEEAQRQEFLAIIVGESERLGRLVNQVLDMAKLESGHGEWHNADVDLRRLVRDAVTATTELARSRGAEIVFEAPETVPLLRADPDRLTQVVLNLISNAVKFVPAEGGRVHVSLHVEGDGLVVRVKDNGPGVPEAERDTIFEKFRQGGDALTRPPGTGLGLPISRRIVDHFGGRMWLENQDGSGACFAFRLPFQPDAGAEGPRPAASEPAGKVKALAGGNTREETP
ncbi:integral membrane sensor signal transduction histidine kinase [Xanthobacter versatilis]|uniref:histidine kinase n=1 Tax=Xanthobacter autotrophicus (strain ATCC BAA-1158 / Py2) TaxID=78245 RepID=A7II27_XANP2|nr:integral membrane sensor signal transduction histidine kinase [Xanthobacter autotrophicus Py2]